MWVRHVFWSTERFLEYETKKRDVFQKETEKFGKKSKNEGIDKLWKKSNFVTKNEMVVLGFWEN